MTTKEQVESLIKKAAESTEPHHALHLSQAALNAANAYRGLVEIDRLPD